MEAKLRKAYAIIRAMRTAGDDRLLWALELYPASMLYAHLLQLGYVWSRQQKVWGR